MVSTNSNKPKVARRRHLECALRGDAIAVLPFDLLDAMENCSGADGSIAA